MLKKQREAGPPSRVSLNVKCGACLHFNKTPAFEKPCIQLGVLKQAEACPSFTPDMCRLARLNLDSLRVLRELTKNLKREELNILAYTFRNVDLLKRYGYQFGQTVLFSVGKDYLSEYFKAYILGISVDGEFVYLTSTYEDLNRGQVFMTLLRDSIMTVDEFKAHRKRLVKAKKLKPPPQQGRPNTIDLLKMPKAKRAEYFASLEKKPLAYEPPTLDSVPLSWLDKRALADGKKRKKKTTTNKVREGKDGTLRIAR
jgi:hypothetical protein